MEINQPAPDFELPDLEGRVQRLSDYHGRIVIVNFWSAECVHSERTDAELLPLLAGWGARVALLPVAPNLNEPPELLAAVARRRGIGLVLTEAGSGLADAWGAQVTPYLLVIDREGILRYRGAFDDVSFRQRTPTRNYLRVAVEALLAGGLPDPTETPPFGCAIVRGI